MKGLLMLKLYYSRIVLMGLFICVDMQLKLL